MHIIQQKRRPRHTRLLLLSACLLASACVYRMPIQQGNYLDPAAIAQIKPGMTRSQVRYVLGTPMVPNAFDSARWDYDFYLKTRQLQSPERGHVVIYFAKETVAKIDSNVKSAPYAPGAFKSLTAARIF